MNKHSLLNLPPSYFAKFLPPLYSQEDKSADEVRVPAKLFTPSGAATWYLTEYDPEEDLAFGYADLGLGPGCAELGYISLREMRSAGVLIEIDGYWDPCSTLAQVQKL